MTPAPGDARLPSGITVCRTCGTLFDLAPNDARDESCPTCRRTEPPVAADGGESDG